MVVLEYHIVPAFNHMHYGVGLSEYSSSKLRCCCPAHVYLRRHSLTLEELNLFLVQLIFRLLFAAEGVSRPQHHLLLLRLRSLDSIIATQRPLLITLFRHHFAIDDLTVNLSLLLQADLQQPVVVPLDAVLRVYFGYRQDFHRFLFSFSLIRRSLFHALRTRVPLYGRLVPYEVLVHLAIEVLRAYALPVLGH